MVLRPPRIRTEPHASHDSFGARRTEEYVHYFELLDSDDSPNRFRSEKSVYHVRHQAFWYECSFTSGSYENFFYLPVDVLGPIIGCYTSQAGIFVPDWDQVIQNATSSLSDFSLLNFIAEIDDVRNLAQNLRHGLQSLNFRNLRNFNPANPLLTYNLGVQPLIADGREILSRAIAWSERVSDYLDGMNRERKLSECHPYTVSVNIPINSVYGYVNYSLQLKLEFTDRANMDVTLHLNPSDPFWEFHSQMQQLGLHLDLGVIWDAVPFSFLVDYVVPIGDALSGNRNWLAPDVSVKRANTSRKMVATWTLWYESFPYWNDYTRQVQASGVTEVYSRSPATPTFDGVDPSLPSLLLSGRQQSNVLALASEGARSGYQNRRSPRPRLGRS